jgi:transcriptional regulator with PAS, ATPase and Fis domain
MMEKAIILSDAQSRELNLNCFPELNLEACPPVGLVDEANLDLAGLEAMEMEMINCAMHKSGNNRTHAAALLKISRSSLNRRIEKHGLDYS